MWCVSSEAWDENEYWEMSFSNKLFGEIIEKKQRIPQIPWSSQNLLSFALFCSLLLSFAFNLFIFFVFIISSNSFECFWEFVPILFYFLFISSFFCKNMEDPVMQKLPLSGFLVKPVQRLCKYPLFLKQLISNTDRLFLSSSSFLSSSIII